MRGICLWGHEEWAGIARTGAGWTIKDSFFDAAEQYQPLLPYNDTDPNGKVYARVMGYYGDRNDKYNSSTSAGPYYNSYTDDDFATWTNAITIN